MIHSYPNLINTDTIHEINGCLFRDLQMDKIISKQSIEILKHICDDIEITNRQSIFSSLKNNLFLEAIKKYRANIVSYEETKKRFLAAKNNIEKLYLRVCLWEDFLLLQSTIPLLKGYNPITDKICAFWSTLEKEQKLVELEQAVQQSRNILSRISVCNLSFMDKNWICKDFDSYPFVEQIKTCAEAIGLNIEYDEGSSIKCSDNFLKLFSKAYSSLFSKETEELENIATIHIDIETYSFIQDRIAIDFYLEIHELIQKAKQYNIPCTLPTISQKQKIDIKNAYDISLVGRGVFNIIPNDIHFDKETPFYFLTGANGGGKTTYLRALGINMVLFLAGCPIFATSANIYPFKFIDTHFPQNELLTTVGRLDEEQKRVSEMLSLSADNGILLFNETFSGTDEQRGYMMALATAKQIIDKNIFGLFVTHFHQVSDQGLPILQATVEELTENNNRSYRIVRTDKRTKSFAKDILHKYKIDKASLEERKRHYSE